MAPNPSNQTQLMDLKYSARERKRTGLMDEQDREDKFTRDTLMDLNFWARIFCRISYFVKIKIWEIFKSPA